jgi:hypothetical protein
VLQATLTQDVGMTWFLRADEQPDGRWTCRLGSLELGTYPNLVLALYNLVETAHECGGRENFKFHLHHRDGRLEIRAATDPVPGEE